MKLLNRMKKQAAIGTVAALALSMSVTTMANDYSGHWAQDVIEEWSGYGVVGGYEDGSFKPNNSMTRAEFAVVLSNVFGLVSAESDMKFTDVSAQAWYHTAIHKVAAAGIMQGADGKFNPSSTITRQEAAVALVNAYRLTEAGSQKVSFTDRSAIASWADEQVSLMASHGYINGRADGSFDPRANITRAEVLTMLDNMTAALIYEAGTYTTDVAGNVIVNTTDAILSEMTVAGNLYLAQGINLGDATLENVTVKGDIVVAGGGVNSIHLNKVTADKAVQVIAQNKVRVKATGKAVSVTLDAGKEVVLEGSFKVVTMTAGSKLDLTKATVEKLIVLPGAEGDVARVTLDKDSSVKLVVANAAVSITGAGKITTLECHVEGVTSTITPSNITGTVAPTIEASKPSGGGGGTGGGGGGITTPDTITSIGVESITVNGSNQNLAGFITINGTAITADLKNVNVLASLGEVSSTTVKFSNLQAGDQITVEAVFGAMSKTKTITVGADGTLNGNVAQVKELFEANKDRIISKLHEFRIYDEVALILEKLGLDINGDYLADGNVDMVKVAALIGQVEDLYDRHLSGEITDAASKAAIEKVKRICEDYGVVFEAKRIAFVGSEKVEGVSLENRITVSVKRGNTQLMAPTNYTFELVR